MPMQVFTCIQKDDIFAQVKLSSTWVVLWSDFVDLHCSMVRFCEINCCGYEYEGQGHYRTIRQALGWVLFASIFSGVDTEMVHVCMYCRKPGESCGDARLNTNKVTVGYLTLQYPTELIPTTSLWPMIVQLTRSSWRILLQRISSWWLRIWVRG